MSGIRVPMVATIVLGGRLTRTPEMKTIPSGSMCRFSVATDQFRQNKKSTMFTDCIAFGKTAEIVASIGKGRPVLVMGDLTKREYEAKDGTQKSAVEVTVRMVYPLLWDDAADDSGSANDDLDDLF